MAAHDHSFVRNAGPLWEEATRSPFLDALAAGSLAADAFRRWLGQDYLFASGLMAFRAILLSKAPRDCHQPLIEGLAALDCELGWLSHIPLACLWSWTSRLMPPAGGIRIS